MNIAIGADHGGFELKNQLRDALIAVGHQVGDFGANSPASSDFPDYAGPVAKAVATGVADRGILVCGSGVGMAIAANKVHGVRAAVGINQEAVALTRQHNDVNILTLGARVTDPITARALVETFLTTPFEAGRHERRVAKISGLEKGT